MPTITPCLWFDGQAEEAARYYVGIFPHSAIEQVSYYGEVGREQHGHAPGAVLMVTFTLNGQAFSALNGGPQHRFTEAVSLQVPCASQDEIDYYWERLGAGGDPAARQCGWLKDKYGLSWQIFPDFIQPVLCGPDQRRAQAMLAALMDMQKLDYDALRRAG